MGPLFVYTPIITNRIRYVLETIFQDRWGIPYQVLTERGELPSGPAGDLRSGPAGAPVVRVINYSAENIPGSFHIRPSGLLTATGTGSVDADALMTSQGGPPTDLFGAIFFLLSRYEEYDPATRPDAFGRYDHRASWAFRRSCLHRPLVDEWLRDFGEALLRQFPGLPIPVAGFQVDPSYDIDQPWCYRNRPWPLLRAARAMIGGRWARAAEGLGVYRGTRPDPFDNFGWMDSLHGHLGIAPPYFFLVSGRPTHWDRNPSRGNPAFAALIRAQALHYPIGLHPSYRTLDRPGLLTEELGWLSGLLDKPIRASRFHYIRFRLPGSYRLLLEHGIQEDYSMGYGSINGFRASYSRPFRWYDLQREAITTLKVVPFCYMEANSYFEQGLDAPGAVAELDRYASALTGAGGSLSMIWHNSSLGVEPRWIGWRETYEGCLQKWRGVWRA